MLYDLAAGQGTRCKEAAGFAAVRAAAVSPGLTLTLSLSLSLTLTLTLTLSLKTLTLSLNLTIPLSLTLSLPLHRLYWSIIVMSLAFAVGSSFVFLLFKSSFFDQASPTLSPRPNP